MSKERSPQLSDLQLAVMRVLWAHGEAAVAEVQDELADERPLATTTVATVLKRMERRGLVTHRSEGRQFVYRARVTEDQVRRSDVVDLTHRWFRGDPTALVNHLLGTGGIAPGDLDRVKAMIDEHANESGKRGRRHGG